MREKPTLRMPKLSVEQRFWSKVDKDGPVPIDRPDLGPCWLWTAATNGHGYGIFHLDGRLVKPHRFAYELLAGPIPAGLQLDHLCRVRLCLNTAHLEPVTNQENIRRGESGVRQREKTHCPQGHPYAAGNIYRYRGKRNCRACSRVRCRAWRAERRASSPPPRP